MIEFVPITKKDFDLFNALSIDKYDQPLDVATVRIQGHSKTDTNPKCNNCGNPWNGYFAIYDAFCPRCGGMIVSKPEPVEREGQ